jgi:hypothetical protein
MLVNSIDPLAPYKVSDDLILELVNVSAIIRIDPEGAAAGACWVQIVEPHNLTKHLRLKEGVFPLGGAGRISVRCPHLVGNLA